MDKPASSAQPMSQQPTPATSSNSSLSPNASGMSELKKDTLYQQAYEQLRLALMSGHMLPGSPISLRTLADELGVSPMPVRDALNRLITQRALELLPNRTVRVPIMTARRFEELTEVRCALECELAKQATLEIHASDVELMFAKNEDMKEAAAESDIKRFLGLNYEFHFTLYRAAQSEVRFPIVEALWLQSGPVLNEYLRNAGFIIATSHHDRICEGLAGKEAFLVAKVIGQDIRDAAAAVSKALPASD